MCVCSETDKSVIERAGEREEEKKMKRQRQIISNPQGTQTQKPTVRIFPPLGNKSALSGATEYTVHSFSLSQ